LPTVTAAEPRGGSLVDKGKINDRHVLLLLLLLVGAAASDRQTDRQTDNNKLIDVSSCCLSVCLFVSVSLLLRSAASVHPSPSHSRHCVDRLLGDWVKIPRNPQMSRVIVTNCSYQLKHLRSLSNALIHGHGSGYASVCIAALAAMLIHARYSSLPYNMSAYQKQSHFC